MYRYAIQGMGEFETYFLNKIEGVKSPQPA